MKNYYLLYAASCAYILLGLWNFFDWRGKNAVLLEASHPHLWVPALGAILLSLSPVLRNSQQKTWLYAAQLFNILAMAVLLKLSLTSASAGDWGCLFRNLLMLGLGLWAVLVSLKEKALTTI